MSVDPLFKVKNMLLPCSLFTLLLSQGMDDGLVPVHADGNKGPNRNVYLKWENLPETFGCTKSLTERICMNGQNWHIKAGRSHRCIKAALNWKGMQNMARMTSARARLAM